MSHHKNMEIVREDFETHDKDTQEKAIMIMP